MTPEIFTALGNLMLDLIPALDADHITQGLGNNVPMPLPGFVCMTAGDQQRLATNETTYNGVDNKTLTNFKQFDVQIDFYGPNSSEWANVMETVLRDDYAVDFMGPLVTPLYCSNAQMVPLTNGEKQYEERWMMTAAFEFNPDVVLAQQSATTLVVVPVNVEATYP